MDSNEGERTYMYKRKGACFNTGEVNCTVHTMNDSDSPSPSNTHPHIPPPTQRREDMMSHRSNNLQL